MRGLFLSVARSASRTVQVRALPKYPRYFPLSSRAVFPSASLQRNFATSFIPKPEVTERVLKVVKNFQNVDGSKVSSTAHFQNDLGLDSLDTVELVMAFEDEFAIEIPDGEADKILTVGVAIDYIAAHPQAK